MKKGLKFRKGKYPFRAIVTDGLVPTQDLEADTMTEEELKYGGRLVCETVDPEFGALLESAPDLYRACELLVEACANGSGASIAAAIREGNAALTLADADKEESGG